MHFVDYCANLNTWAKHLNGSNAHFDRTSVLVVHVGLVRMCVIAPATLVGMCMRFPCGVFGTVLMPVVLVMQM